MDSTAHDAGASAAQLLAHLSSVLQDVRDSLALIGGAAVNYWCEPRFTKDIDFTVVADAAIMARITALLTEDGFAVTRLQEPDAPSGPDFVRFVRPDSRWIVEFLAAKTEFQALAIERALQAAEAAPFPIASREDLIIMKLLANRPHDQSDAIALAAPSHLDDAYLDHWASIWEIGDRLERLRAIIRSDQLGVS